MTKCSLLCFIFSLLLLGAVVQSHAQVEFSLGMKAGLNIGTLSFDPDLYEGSTSISKSGVLGFMAGGVAEVGFANMFAVQLEPGYNLKATKWEDTQGGKRTISVGVLQIPILFKAKFLRGPVRPYGFLGPNLGIVLSAKDKIEAQGQTQDTDVKDQVAGLDFALDFGGGAEFEVGRAVSLTGDIRYSLGLTNLNSPPNTPAGAQITSVKSRGFQILFGVLFQLVG